MTLPQWGAKKINVQIVHTVQTSYQSSRKTHETSYYTNLNVLIVFMPVNTVWVGTDGPARHYFMLPGQLRSSVTQRVPHWCHSGATMQRWKSLACILWFLKDEGISSSWWTWSFLLVHLRECNTYFLICLCPSLSKMWNTIIPTLNINIVSELVLFSKFHDHMFRIQGSYVKWTRP